MRIPKKVREKMFDKFEGRCAYCGEPLEEKFHVIPQHLGGTDEESNLTPACASCNIAKGTYTVDEFRMNIIRYFDVLYTEQAKLRILHRYKIIKLCITEMFAEDLKFHFERVQDGSMGRQ